MNTNTRKYKKRVAILVVVGSLLIVFAPISFFIVPMFRYVICSAAGNGCGFNGLGIYGYALYAAITLFILGLIGLFLGLYYQFKQFKK